MIMSAFNTDRDKRRHIWVTKLGNEVDNGQKHLGSTLDPFINVNQQLHDLHAQHQQ